MESGEVPHGLLFTYLEFFPLFGALRNLWLGVVWIRGGEGRLVLCLLVVLDYYNRGFASRDATEDLEGP